MQNIQKILEEFLGDEAAPKKYPPIYRYMQLFCLGVCAVIPFVIVVIAVVFNVFSLSDENNLSYLVILIMSNT